MPTLSSNSRAALRQYLTENFSQAELEELTFDLGVDAETLPRETKSEFARALIVHFEDRGEAGRLGREVFARRPNPALEREIFAGEDRTTDDRAIAAPQRQSSRSKARLLIPAVLAAAALVAFVALLLRPGAGTMEPAAQPSAVMTARPAIASDVPGTPLTLNTTIRSGVDPAAKQRDVWRVPLQAQHTYTIEIRSSVQDGLGVGLMNPNAARVPDTQETADVNVCSNASACGHSFTTAFAGDYYIVVYGMRPLVSYDLTVHDR